MESFCFFEEGTIIYAVFLTENTIFLMDVKVYDEVKSVPGQGHVCYHNPARSPIEKE